MRIIKAIALLTLALAGNTAYYFIAAPYLSTMRYLLAIIAIAVAMQAMQWITED